MVTDEVIKLLEIELFFSVRAYAFKNMGDWTTYTNIKFKNIEGTLGIFYKKWKRQYEYEIIRQSLENIENFSYLNIKSKA